MLGEGGMKQYLRRSSRISFRTLVSSLRLQLDRTIIIAVPELVCMDLKSSCSDLDCEFVYYNVDDEHYFPIPTADLRTIAVDIFIVVSFFGLNPKINAESLSQLRQFGTYLVLDGSHIDHCESPKLLFDASFFSLYKKSRSVEGSYLFIDDQKIQVQADPELSKKRLIGFGLISLAIFLFCRFSRIFISDLNYISVISKILSSNNFYPQSDYFSLANEFVSRKFPYRNWVDLSELKKYVSRKISGISVDDVIIISQNSMFILIPSMTSEKVCLNESILKKWGGCFWPDRNISEKSGDNTNRLRNKVFILYFGKVLASYLGDRGGH